MYQKAINTDKKFYKAYYNLANIYLEDGRYNMAVANYKKAISSNRENAYLHYNLACAYMKLGKIKKAKSSLLQILEASHSFIGSNPDIEYVPFTKTLLLSLSIIHPFFTIPSVVLLGECKLILVLDSLELEFSDTSK